jgi:hypothetical protein
MTTHWNLWPCTRCGEQQVAIGPVPDVRICPVCEDAESALKAFTEVDAGIPERYRGLTRESWEACFQHPWPAKLASWAGSPHWVALWGPTGTGKTGIATVLLAEHLRTASRGRWISGPELSRRLHRDLAAAEDVIAPLLVTPSSSSTSPSPEPPPTGTPSASSSSPAAATTAACPPSSPASSSPS